jgi:hypothetical protein
MTKRKPNRMEAIIKEVDENLTRYRERIKTVMWRKILAAPPLTQDLPVEIARWVQWAEQGLHDHATQFSRQFPEFERDRIRQAFIADALATLAKQNAPEGP